MNDATTAMITDLAGKGVSAVLGGAGGTAVKMVLNLIFEGTTDPTAEMLNKINEQLLDIKGQIKELPDAVTIYQAYNQSILEAQLKVSQFKDMLLFTGERKKLYKTYESYLETLVDEQWKTMENFLTPGVKDNANSHITNILKTAYGVDKQDVTETALIDIKFGDSQRSYARLRSSTDLQKIPANFQDYVKGQILIRDTVLIAISGIVSSVQNIISVFKKVNIEALPAKNRKRIQERLNNEELKAGYMVIDPEFKTSMLYADLVRPLSMAPAYLCGNAFAIYNGILDGKSFTLKNLATKQFAALGAKTNIKRPPGAMMITKQYNSKGEQEYISSFWTTKFDSNGTAWKMNFVEKKPGVVTIKAPDLGYLFVHNIASVPSVTTKGEMGNKGYSQWKVGLVPQKDSSTGHKTFCFTFDNVEKEKALVNVIPFIGDDHLGYYKLDHYDGNHQWDLQPANN